MALRCGNLAEALVILGDWDAAEGELTHAADSDGLADYEYLTRYRAWLAALRGDSKTAETMLAALPDLRASENPQDKAANSNVKAFTAAARHHSDQGKHRSGAGRLAFRGSSWRMAAVSISRSGTRAMWAGVVR